MLLAGKKYNYICFLCCLLRLVFAGGQPKPAIPEDEDDEYYYDVRDDQGEESETNKMDQFVEL